MDEATIRKQAASQAINLTISMVGGALDMKFPPGEDPTESREIMIAVLGRTVADLRVAAAKQENVIGWGSLVILKRPKKKPAWVKWVPGGFNVDPKGFEVDDDGRITRITRITRINWSRMTSENERTVAEVAKHLSNGRLVNWGGRRWSDEHIRRAILELNKAYRKQNPSFRRKNKWNVQPPTRWNVFYVLGMDDVEDQYTRRRASEAMKAGKRIIDITGSAPVDLTDAYQWAIYRVRWRS